MIRGRRRGWPTVGAALLGAALALAASGCSAPEPPIAETVATQLPDLSDSGYLSIACADGEVIGELFVPPEAPYTAQCWTGTPDDPFVRAANVLLNQVLDDTGGVDVTGDACPDDVLNAQAGVACRAVYVGKQGNDALVRVIVTLTDVQAVLDQVTSDQPTSEDITKALQGAQVEVLIGTEPITPASAAP